jgi:CheY-like chemotaxis protein
METANRRVLIIEDNFDNIFIYRTLLEHRGFTVMTATDGKTGLHMAKAEQPDLVLMDVSMPGVDGWQATSALKADKETASIPVIILTAHALAADRLHAEEVGADGYIAKPAEPMQVLSAVERTLAEPGYRAGFGEAALPG